MYKTSSHDEVFLYNLLSSSKTIFSINQKNIDFPPLEVDKFLKKIHTDWSKAALQIQGTDL